MRNLSSVFCQLLVASFKGVSEKLWVLTHIAIATYLVTLSVSQSSINHFVTYNFNESLGADGIISSRVKLNDEIKQSLSELDIEFSEVVESRIALTNDGSWLQVKAKGVDSHYPIAGKVVITKEFGGELVELDSGPAHGDIWLDEATAAKLGFSLGDKVPIGQVALTFTKVLKQEPDWLLSVSNPLPRALVSIYDFNVISAEEANSSRGQYRYLLSNSVENEAALSEIIGAITEANLQVFSEGKHPFSDMVDRAFKIFSLVSILLIALAAVALNMSEQDIFKSTAKTCAILMSLGMSKIKVLLGWWAIMLTKLVLVLLLATVVSIFIALAIIGSLEGLFSDLTLQWQPSDLFNPLMTISLLYLASLLPHFVKLIKAEVKSLLVDQGNLVAPIWAKVFSLLLSFLTVIFIYSDNVQLTTMLIGSTIVTYMVINLFVRIIMVLLKKVRVTKLPSLSLAIQMLEIRKTIRLPQIISLGMCAYLLALSTVLSEEFIVAVNKYGFSEQGDMLFDKASKNDLASLQRWLTETDSKLGFYQPFQFAKLVKVNDKLLAELDLPVSESSSKINSPVRLSWSPELPTNLEIVKGDWPHLYSSESFVESSIQLISGISVEQEVLEDLRIQIGDVLTFASQGQEQSFYVSASHQRKPGGNLISFWFIRGADSAANQLPHPTLYLGDVFLSLEAKQTLVEFWRTHPQFQMRPVASLKESVTKLVNTVSLIIALFTGFLIAVCLLVIWTGINSCVEQDKVRNALIMSFGKGKFACVKLTIFEWLLTGVIAFSGAMWAAYGTMQLVYAYHFGSTYSPQFDIYFWAFVEGVSDFTILAVALSLVSFNTSIKALLTNTNSTQMKSEKRALKRMLTWRVFKLWRRFYAVQKSANNKRS